jgi:hypothetical protein
VRLFSQPLNFSACRCLARYAPRRHEITGIHGPKGERGTQNRQKGHKRVLKVS